MGRSENIEKLASEWMVADADKIDTAGVYYYQTRDVFQARHSRMINDLLLDKKIADDDAYIVAAIAGEIGNNSFDHNLGNWRDVPGIFFGYELSDNEIKIALADRGQGVLATLKKVKPELTNDKEALKVAFTERISGRAPENRGNGLKFVKENVESKKMHLEFHSGNAKAELDKEIKITESDKIIQGCLAILTAKL
jgi:hypothetical protein